MKVSERERMKVSERASERGSRHTRKDAAKCSLTHFDHHVMMEGATCVHRPYIPG